jgi:hypothetical protein
MLWGPLGGVKAHAVRAIGEASAMPSAAGAGLSSFARAVIIRDPLISLPARWLPEGAPLEAGR